MLLVDAELILAHKLLALLLHLISELPSFLRVFKIFSQLLVTVGTKRRLQVPVLILLSKSEGVKLLMLL
jgi:hypothetical protein